MSAVTRVVVAVPARDEADLLGGCLESVVASIEALGRVHPGVACEVVVVLDGCTDDSAAVAAAFPVTVVTADGVGVGRARHLGVERGLRAIGELDGVWVANTDADTRVPVRWLVEQVDAAARGCDLLLGTVVPVDVADPAVARAWRAAYRLADGHAHVHGANLGVRASVYVAAGGFGPLGAHEDVDLVHRVRALGARWHATDRTRVRTSGRVVGRVEVGFSTYLDALSTAERPAPLGRPAPRRSPRAPLSAGPPVNVRSAVAGGERGA